MSWTTNQAIRFRLGTIALWNKLSRPIIDMRDPALQLLKEGFERNACNNFPNEFEDMTTRELPATVEESRKQKEMYDA